jgi:hypothetical protein
MIVKNGRIFKLKCNVVFHFFRIAIVVKNIHEITFTFSDSCDQTFCVRTSKTYFKCFNLFSPEKKRHCDEAF